MKRKTVVLIGVLALTLSGCGAVKETSDGTEVQTESLKEESTVVEAADELIDSDRFEGESDTDEYADDSFQKTDSIDLYEEQNADCYDDIFFDIMSNREQADMKAAYEYIIDIYEKAYPSCTYDLIYFNDDNIPELVAGMDGYFVSMYTFCDGRIYSMMHNWAYGAGGNGGYEYIEKEGIIRNYNSDYAGAVMHTSYFAMTDQPSIVVKYFLEQSYEDEDGNIVQDESEDAKAEWKYYYSTNDSEKEELSEKEFQSYMIDGEYLSVCGKYTKEEVVEEINKIEALSQND